ncbi:MAG TPA: PAS domain S-box protein [Opitutaceae bacterium]|nr:PAS domain S-box protein [Opitutaceae bacterium]
MPFGSSLVQALLGQQLLPVLELDLATGAISRAGPALAALLGRTPESLRGIGVSELVPEAERTRVRQALATRTARPFAFPLGDTAAPRSFSATLLCDAPEAGRAVLWLDGAPASAGSDRDGGDDIFRQIVCEANEGIWILDADGRTTFVNECMAAILGYELAELRSREFAEFLVPDEVADHFARLSRRRDGVAECYERRLRRKDGSLIWTLVAGNPLTDSRGCFQGSFGLFSDITARKRADRALQLSEERYRSLLAAATDYVFMVPFVGGQPGATVHGAGCVRVTGYEPADYARDPLLWHRMIAAEDWPAVEQHIRRAQAGAVSDTIEHRLVRRDGMVRWVRSTLVPRRDPAGELVAIDGLVTDITERTTAVRQLREREALYRAVIETSADGFLITDLAGRLLEANDAYVRRSGYSRESLLTMRLSDLDAENTPAELAEHITRIRREGSALFDTRHRTKDGTVWQAELNSSFWPIGDGRLFVFIRDVHLRNRSEALLRARFRLSELSRQQSTDVLMRATLDTAEFITGSATGFFFLLDADGTGFAAQIWSTNTLRLLGETASAAAPATAQALWCECQRITGPTVQNHLAHQPAGLPPGHPPLTRALTVPVRRGERTIALVGVGNKTTPYHDDDIDTVRELADLAMDLVERVQAEQSLRRSEHQLRLIIDSVPALIAYVDSELRFRLLNATFPLWFGEKVARIVQQRIPTQLGAHTWAELEPSFTRALAGEVVSFDRDFTFRTAGRRWLHCSLTPDRGHDGSVRGIVILASDLTAQKQLEEQLLRAQRLEVVGRLASGIAHDLNNILQPVLMAPRLLRPAIRDPEALELVNTVEGSVRRGAEIIKQLLAFGRGSNVRRLPLRLDTLLVELTRILHETLPKSIVLHCDLPVHTAPVHADATQLHQVLMNLCVNARDAMRGGGTLTLRLAATEFAEPPAGGIPVGRAGRFQVITVSDTGSGIPRENLPRLFDPFFTTKDVGEGTGLGLATVLGIVRSHDGFLRVGSTVGVGSRFEVFLPETAGEPAPASTAHLPHRAPRDGRNRHILVVDDEAPVRDLIRRTLTQQGYRVSEAANGAEALVVLARDEQGVDLIVTDLLMPVMDGASLIHELHRHSPSLPLIAISGNRSDRPAVAAARTAVRAVLAKPFDAVTLLAAIDEALT